MLKWVSCKHFEHCFEHFSHTKAYKLYIKNVEFDILYTKNTELCLYITKIEIFGMFVYSLLQKTKISLQICIKGEQMIKGVNHRVVEVTDTQSEYFDRIIFFVKPEHCDTSEGKIREKAKVIADVATAPPPSRIKHARLKRFIKLFSAAVIGALITAIIMSIK